MKKTTISELVVSKIYTIRDHKVMLDRDLAELYGVPTKELKQAVRRNVERFPDDFMFEMSTAEFEHRRSQFVTSDPGDSMGLRYAPFCCPEHGVLMLSSLLNSAAAIAFLASAFIPRASPSMSTLAYTRILPPNTERLMSNAKAM